MVTVYYFRHLGRGNGVIRGSMGGSGMDRRHNLTDIPQADGLTCNGLFLTVGNCAKFQLNGTF